MGGVETLFVALGLTDENLRFLSAFDLFCWVIWPFRYNFQLFISENGKDDRKSQISPNLLLPSGITTPPLPHFVCEGCGIKFKSVSNLQAHQARYCAGLRKASEDAFEALMKQKQQQQQQQQQQQKALPMLEMMSLLNAKSNSEQDKLSSLMMSSMAAAAMAAASNATNGQNSNR